MAVQNKKRFEIIKIMIENGHIKEFRQIFDYIPKSIIKEELRTNNDRITRLISNVGEFRLEEILTVSELLHTDFIKTVQIACTQILNEELRKSKRRKR